MKLVTSAKLIMRRLRYIIAIIAAVHAFTPKLAFSAESITVPAGTVVSLRTVEELHPRNLHIGDRVVLRVASDVIIQGKTVIAAGASAHGEITAAKKKGMAGVNAEIGLSVRSVEAVDGTNVALYGTKYSGGQSKTTESVIFTILCCVLFLLMQGEDASIPSGTLIDAELAGTVQVQVE
ncbi:MAG TPA: hypothetical protein PLF13_00530 [candidate division Zixibacteria bacterium]|nr:hypothetical protein [candidate division Zixibacteria bacterium]